MVEVVMELCDFRMVRYRSKTDNNEGKLIADVYVKH